MAFLKTTLIATATCALLAGCQTYDAYTGDKKVSKANKYGAIGAVVCGALGSRESSKRARNAALGCGLIAMGVGAYMDEQERKLRQQLTNSGVQVAREGNNIRLVMPNSITFSTNKSNLNNSIYNTLDSVAKVLTEFNETDLEVGGHTDSTGSDSHNLALSQERARSVANYLSQRNIPRSRLRTVGYGEKRPIADNSTENGRAENRRAELLIVPQSS